MSEQKDIIVKIVSQIDTSDLQIGLDAMESSIGAAVVKMTNKFSPLTAAVLGVGTGVQETGSIVGSSLVGMVDKSNGLAIAFSGLEVAVSLFNKREEISNGLSLISQGMMTAQTIGALALGTAHSVMAGEMTLATAATEALGLAQMALPTGLVVAAIGGIAAAVIGLIACQNNEVSTSELIGKKWEEAANAGKVFEDGIATAKGVLSGFNDEIIISSEDSSKLTDSISDVQSQISTISKTATDERRTLTQDEIDRMGDLFNQMHTLSSKELEVQNDYQDAVLTRAQTSAEMNKMTKEEAQNILKSADDTKNQVIAKAEEQYENEIVLIKKKHEAAGTLNTEAYNAELKQAYQNLEDAKTVAEEKNSEIYSVVEQGYLDSNDQANEALEATKEYNRLKEEENKRYNEGVATGQGLNQEAYNEHNEKLKNIDKEYLKHMKGNTADQLVVWAQMLGDTLENGGKITQADKENAQAIIDSWDDLPKETKDAMKKTLKPMLEQAASYEGKFYQAGENQGNNLTNGFGSKQTSFKDKVINILLNASKPITSEKELFEALGINMVDGIITGMNSRSYQLTKAGQNAVTTTYLASKNQAMIMSPSRLFRDKIGKNISLGLAEGIKDETGLLQQVGENQIQELNKKMMIAVNNEHMKMNVANKSNHLFSMITSGQDSVSTMTGQINGVIENHISIDGRETAVALTPFISEEIAFQGGL